MSIRQVEYTRDVDDRVGMRCRASGGPEVKLPAAQETPSVTRPARCSRVEGHPGPHRCLTTDPVTYTESWWEWD